MALAGAGLRTGIELMLNAEATRVAQSAAQVHLTVRAGHVSLVLEGSHLLVATGRIPNTNSLNVSAAALEWIAAVLSK